MTWQILYNKAEISRMLFEMIKNLENLKKKKCEFLCECVEQPQY
jgi:hypothetical protein